MNEDTLAHVDLFSTLDKKDLKTLEQSCQHRSYSAGSTIISQGDSGVGLYVITKGHVKISRAAGPDRGEENLGSLGPAQVIGEMSLLDDLPRSATVVAEDDVTALVLPVREFRTFLRNNPDVALKLLGVLSRRLRKAEAQR